MEMHDPYDLARFLSAQAPVYDAVVAELRAGRKRSHWMWFIFPQLRELGRSATAQFYGIDSLAEARAYVDHPVLGARITECTELVLTSGQTSLNAIFGSPDDLKFHSSMTLFARAAGDEPSVFRRALARFNGGRLDERSVALLESET